MKLEHSSVVGSISDTLASLAAVLSVLSRLDQCHICEGNADGKFGDLLLQPGFLKRSGM